MSDIRLTCEYCGKAVRAPHELAGKRSKCPACGNSLYVPTPEDEIEELPLAPEDVSDLQHEAALLAERRKLDLLLSHEDKPADDPGSGSGRSGGADSGAGSTGALDSANRTERAIRNYLAAMRASDLAAADRAMTVLRMQPRTARETIDRMAADQIPPPEVGGLPAGVYQGFLKTLRSKL